MMVLDKEDGRWRAGVLTPRTPWPLATARGNTHAGTRARTCWAGIARREPRWGVGAEGLGPGSLEEGGE